MKITKATYRLYLGSLLFSAGLASAHPGLSAGKKKDAPCPFLENKKAEEEQHRMGQGYKQAPMRALNERSGDGGGVPEGGFEAVMKDLKAIMTDSQDFWPADFGHYGGLFIRLAWHCSGSYRDSDGRGGCDGGRIRFDPELTWMDNGNLDKALKLLEPIKEKYGSALSWGDLIVLSGTAAMEDMGAPVFGFCGGRIDDADGSDSLKLGPSPEQEDIAPCQDLDPSMQGKCLDVEGTALGPTTVGLIYVDPAGPVDAVGDLEASGEDIRKAFTRMGFNDTETVALIGGGHAFGKSHGPCVTPPCGEGDVAGIGANTYTSGFEGKWTVTPTKWTNDFFNNMFDYDWNNITGPGGFIQWEPSGRNGTAAPDIFMLTTDLALATDPLYKPISEAYAADIDALGADFAAAWYRLTSSDMGPHDRCIGDLVPDPQWWQYTLPKDSRKELPNYVPVRTAIQEILDEDDTAANAFINLAYRASFTYRATDYRGGLNGARIRFEPESRWPENEGTADALAKLEPVKKEFSDVTYADLIVLAGITALENENEGLSLDFCGGYVDAENANGCEELAPREYNTPYITVSDDCIVKGLSNEQCVALASCTKVSSEYYTGLLQAADGGGGSSSSDYDEYELALLEGDFKPIVQIFASDEEMLLKTFTSAWSYMMTADRYKDNRANACTNVKVATKKNEDVESTDDSGASSSPMLMAGAVVGAGLALLFFS